MIHYHWVSPEWSPLLSQQEAFSSLSFRKLSSPRKLFPSWDHWYSVCCVSTHSNEQCEREIADLFCRPQRHRPGGFLCVGNTQIQVWASRMLVATNLEVSFPLGPIIHKKASAHGLLNQRGCPPFLLQEGMICIMLPFPTTMPLMPHHPLGSRFQQILLLMAYLCCRELEYFICPFCPPHVQRVYLLISIIYCLLLIYLVSTPVSPLDSFKRQYLKGLEVSWSKKCL